VGGEQRWGRAESRGDGGTKELCSGADQRYWRGTLVAVERSGAVLKNAVKLRRQRGESGWEVGRTR